MKAVKVKAHSNIALLKYWGKKNITLNTPFQDSVSLTVNRFFTETTVSCSPETNDLFILDEKPITSWRGFQWLQELRNNVKKPIQSTRVVPIIAFPVESIELETAIPTSLVLLNSCLNLARK